MQCQNKTRVAVKILTKIKSKMSSMTYWNNLIYKSEKRFTKYSFVEIGKLYGVSDNAVRKWCKKYGLPYRRRDVTEFLKENHIVDTRKKWML